jgi:tetratricopeptide (TPR) repeat protein
LGRALQLAISFMFFLTLPSAARAMQDANGTLALAERQFDSGDYADAIGTLQGILAKNRDDAAAYFWLARSYYELRDYDNAVSQAEQATRLAPQNSVYHQWLGRSYGSKADRERSFFLARKTKKEFEEAVRLDPGNISARRDLEDFYLEAPWILGGSRDRAMEQVNAIAAKDAVAGHLARADYWRDAKKMDLVEEEYHWVFQLKPHSADPYFEIAGYYINQKDVTKLRSAIELAAQANSSEPRLAYYHGVAGILAGTDLTQAEQYLKSFIASTPERSDWPSHAAAREWLGQLYEMQGRRVQAAEQYRAAIHIDPDRKSARERLKNLEKSGR